MNLRLILSIVLGTALLLVPVAVSADIIQPDHDGDNDFYFQVSISPATHVIAYQTLGNGLTGSATGISVYVAENKNTFATSNLDTIIECFNDAGYSSACTNSSTGSMPVGMGNFPFGWATTTISSYALDATKYYRLKIDLSSSMFYDGFIFGTHPDVYPNGAPDANGNNVNGTVDTLAFKIFGATVVVDTTTRINTVTPASGSTIATSTAATFGATGYIKDTDFKNGMFVQIKYGLYADAASPAGPASPDLLYTTLVFPLSSSGNFSVSTTSPALKKGQYTMQTSIQTTSIVNNVLNFLGFGQFANNGILSATSTQFVGDSFSGYDIYVASTTANITNYLASSTISLAACSSWTSFNLGDCMNLMFVPQTGPILQTLTDFKNGFLSYAPIGYITRAIVILSGTTPTDLPGIHVQIPLGQPGHPEYTNGFFTLNIMDMLQGGADLADSIHTTFGDDVSLREATEPFIKLSYAMFLIIFIVQDIMKMRNHNVSMGKSKLR